MKIDPYGHKERYISWKESVKDGIPNLSMENSKVILEYLLDMEFGLNISTRNKKGGRSYLRLNSLRQRIIFMAKKFKEVYGIDALTKLTEREVHALFGGMRNGTIPRVDGKVYKDPANFVKIFKAFWHWHQKVNRKKGITIEDITIDLDTSKEKPEWVYLNEEQIMQLCEDVMPKYKVLIMFLFDSGIRSPGELINIKVSDFHNNFREVSISDEISKTFGRRIKLMLCSKLIKEYVKSKKLGLDDYIFPIKYSTVNLYLQIHAKKLFGDEKSLAGQKYLWMKQY